MGKASRDKGKRGELEARDAVREHWHSPHCHRSAQAGGSFAADLLKGPPGLHLEVKRYAKIAALRFLDQAIQDSGCGATPVVLLKEDRGEWCFLLRMRDTEAFLNALHEADERQALGLTAEQWESPAYGG